MKTRPTFVASLFATALAASLTSLPAMAQDGSSAANALASRIYVSPMLNYVLPDDDSLFDSGEGASITAGYRLGGFLALEAGGSYYRLSGDGTAVDSGEQFGGELAALISPLPSYRDVYAVVSAGYSNTHGAPGGRRSYDGPIYTAGLGWLHKLNDYGTALRFETRYQYNDHGANAAGTGGSGNFGDVVFKLGLVLPLGESAYAAEPDAWPTDATQPPQVQVVPATPVTTNATWDSDYDGIADDQDACPGTPSGLAVNAQGCETQPR